MNGLEGRFLALIKNLEEEKRLADKRAKQLYALTGGLDRPCFLAHNSVADVDQTGDGTIATIEFDTEIFDQGGDFASNTFTAPVDGKYPLKARVNAENVVGTSGVLKCITSKRTYYGDLVNAGLLDQGEDLSFAFSSIVDMDANDTAYITLTISGGAKTVRIGGHATLIYTFFSGALLC